MADQKKNEAPSDQEADSPATPHSLDVAPVVYDVVLGSGAPSKPEADDKSNTERRTQRP